MSLKSLRKSDRQVHGDRRVTRIRVVCDDSKGLHVLSTLRFSGDSVLITGGIRLELGSKVTLMPDGEGFSTVLFELRGTVVHVYENILTPAFANDRFLMGIRLEVGPEQLLAIRNLIEERGVAMPDDDEGAILNSAVWRVRN
jgi:hypothetical protein